MTLTEIFLVAFPRYDLPFVQVVPSISDRAVKYTVSTPADASIDSIQIAFFKYGDVMCNTQVKMKNLTLLHQLLTTRGFLSE